MGTTLILIGAILIGLGLLFNMMPEGGIPMLPGDILIQNDQFTVFFPIVTSVVVSVFLTVLLRLF